MESVNHSQYRAHLARQGLSPQTVRAYIGAVERLETAAGSPIEQVTPDQAAAWINRPGLSRSTRNSYHRHLAAWCAWSGSGLLADVRRPKAGDPAPKPLAPRQVELVLDACTDDKDTAIVLLGLLAGLRCSEIAAFSGDDLDRWESTIRVTGKGGKDARVPAPAALIRHAARMPRSGLWFPSPTNDGDPVTAWAVRKRIRVLARRADAGHITPHRLRHTYATQMVRAGVPLSTVQKCMRHSQLSTTAIYLLVTDEDMRDAAASLPWAA